MKSSLDRSSNPRLACYGLATRIAVTGRPDSACSASCAQTSSTNERGPVERRKAGTRSLAFAAARTLLDVAERRDWHRGEVVSVEVRQADE